MTTLPSKLIFDGDAGRYLKPSYVENGQVSICAFDLRLNRTIPEEFVSFFLSRGRSNEEKFQDVLRQSESRLAVKDSGFICLISIETALSLINEGNDVIWFSDQQLPHLGLYYSKQVSSQEILGAKTLLSWLASERFEPVAAFKRSLQK